MKFSAGIPKTFTIPDKELPGLARRARARGMTLHFRGVEVEDIIEQARLEGLVDLPEDYIREGDEDRIFIRGTITTPWKEHLRRKRARRERARKAR
jgi:DNA-binding transcriptional MocR family regulator